MFKDKLKKAMQELHLTQAQVAGMTGKSRGSVSQYLSGRQTPPDYVQRDIAVSLGLDADYFAQPDTEPPTGPVEPAARRPGGIRRMSVKQAAALLGADKVTVAKGLQQGVFPWGYGIKTTEKSWAYIINADAFARIEGVAL